MNLVCQINNVLNSLGRERARVIKVLVVAIPLIVLGICEMPGNAVIAQERDGARSVEAETGPRRPAERDGQRRSAEAETGPQSAEGEHREGHSAEREGRNKDSLSEFKPQTKRERALFLMIQQLQREVAALRREVQSQGEVRPASESHGDGAGSDEPSSAAKFKLPARWQSTKEGRVFQAYDKNGDDIVTLEEWLAMTNGNISPARRKISTQHFKDADPNGDGKFTPAEFIWWRQIGSKEAVKRASKNRSRESEGSNPHFSQSLETKSLFWA